MSLKKKKNGLVKNKKAKCILKYLLENFTGEGRYDEYPVAGFFKECGRYTCFDDVGYSCFVEQTKSKKKAIKWCLRKIDTDELYG